MKTRSLLLVLLPLFSAAPLDIPQETHSKADHVGMQSHEETHSSQRGGKSSLGQDGNSDAQNHHVPELSCPSLNINTQDRRDEEELKSIESAEECSNKCREKTTCKFWTWHHKDAGIWALDCVLMSGYGYANSDNNVISGSRTCNPGDDPVEESNQHPVSINRSQTKKNIGNRMTIFFKNIHYGLVWFGLVWFGLVLSCRYYSDLSGSNRRYMYPIFGVLMCVSILVYCTNSLGINYKGNFTGSIRALALSPSSTTAAGEGALFEIVLKIQFKDKDYKEKLLPFFKNLSDLLKPSINFDFYDFCSERRVFRVSDVFGAPGHAPVHSGIVLSIVLSNPDLHLNIHIDLAPTIQLYNLVSFKMTKGPVKGTYRGDVHSTLPELIENIKLTMNEMGNDYTLFNKNCIRFKDILLEKLVTC